MDFQSTSLVFTVMFGWMEVRRKLNTFKVGIQIWIDEWSEITCLSII